MPPHERRPGWLLLQRALVPLLIATIAVLLFRDWLRESDDPDARRKAAFESIHALRTWGTDQRGKSASGLGSTLEFTRLYRVYLQDFLAAHQIRSVVDAGCGDWEFSQAIDWKGIDYLGVDIVPAVIDANQRRFGAANVRFARADIVRDELPKADLLLVKDVLQHLPDADVARFLAQQLPRYRHVLIVNDVDPRTLSAEAKDTSAAGYRPLDLTRPPYSLPATKVLAWHQSGATKLVLHLQR
jgi:SAM-dependent methyltransferase